MLGDPLVFGLYGYGDSAKHVSNYRMTVTNSNFPRFLNGSYITNNVVYALIKRNKRVNLLTTFVMTVPKYEALFSVSHAVGYYYFE